MRVNELLRVYCSPVYKMIKYGINQYYTKKCKKNLEKKYFEVFSKELNWENPQDLNEKINWLKLHVDLKTRGNACR